MNSIQLKPKNKNHVIFIELNPISNLWSYQIFDKLKPEEDSVIVEHKTWDRSRVLRMIDYYADLSSPENQNIKKDIQMNIDPKRSQDYKDYMHHPSKRTRIKF